MVLASISSFLSAILLFATSSLHNFRKRHVVNFLFNRNRFSVSCDFPLIFHKQLDCWFFLLLLSPCIYLTFNFGLRSFNFLGGGIVSIAVLIALLIITIVSSIWSVLLIFNSHFSNCVVNSFWYDSLSKLFQSTFLVIWSFMVLESLHVLVENPKLKLANYWQWSETLPITSNFLICKTASWNCSGYRI